VILYHRFGSESIAFQVEGLRHDQSMKRPLTIGILADLTSASDGAGPFDLAATARPPVDGEAGVSVVRAPEWREDDPSGVLRRIANEAAARGMNAGRFRR
jgi:hypothetical protein